MSTLRTGDGRRRKGSRRRSRIALLLRAWQEAERDVGILRNVSVDEAETRTRRLRDAYLRAVEQARASDRASRREMLLPLGSGVATGAGNATALSKAESGPPGLVVDEDVTWAYEADWAS